MSQLLLGLGTQRSIPSMLVRAREFRHGLDGLCRLNLLVDIAEAHRLGLFLGRGRHFVRVSVGEEAAGGYDDAR